MNFEVRVFHLDSGAQDSGSFETAPELQQAADVIRLMREFLVAQPPQFKARIPFMKRGDLVLEWSAADGGVAFATWSEPGEPLAFAAFALDALSEAGQGVLCGFGQTIHLQELPSVSGPTVWLAPLPGKPELLPLLHLLTTSLAAVYFEGLSNHG